MTAVPVRSLSAARAALRAARRRLARRCSAAATRDATQQDRRLSRTITAQRHPITLQGRRAHRRDLHRPQPRRPDARRSAPTCSPSRRPGSTKRPAASSSTCRSARPTDRAAAEFDARNPFDPGRLRRAAQRRRCARPTSRGPAALAEHQAQLPEADRRSRPLRAVAERSRPDRRRRPLSRTGRTGISAAPASAISPPWSTTRPTWCSRAAKRRSMPPRRSVVIDKYRKGENPSGDLYAGYEPGQDQRCRQMIKHASASRRRRSARRRRPSGAADEHIAPAPRVSIQAFCETVETAAAVQAAGEDRRLAKAHSRSRWAASPPPSRPIAVSPTPNVIIIESDDRGRGHPRRPRSAGRGLRRRHARHRDRPHQRRHALSRADPPRRQRLPDRAGRHDRHRARDLRAVLGAGRQAGRPHHRGGRRQRRRRRLHRRAQHRLGDRARPCARCGGRRSRPRRSAPPASTTTRTRRRASPTRCSRPTASTPHFVDRLLSKCTDHLSLLAAPATLDRVYDFGAEAFDSILDVAARH